MTVATETAGLPTGWSQAPLGGVVQSIRETAALVADQPYELWSIPSFSNGLPERVVGSEIGSAKLAVSPSDVLISKINPRINRVWMVAEPPEGYIQVASTEWIVARIDESTPVLPRFLRWYATSPAFRALIESGVQGVTGSHTRAKTPQVLKLPVPVPPLAEQRRIIEILEEQLSRLDAALDSVRVVREKAAQFRRSLLHAAFTGALTATSPLGDHLPVGWEQRLFSDIASVDSGLVDPAQFGDAPHVAPNHIESNSGRLLEYRTVAEDGVTSGKHRFRAGHILYSKIRPHLNKVTLVSFDGLCSADMYPISTSQNARWLARVMLAPDFVSQASSAQTRTVLPKINVRELSRLTVPVPPLPEQDRIVQIVDEQLSRLDAAMAVPDQIEKRSAALRRSLLHAAFSGRLTEQWREHAHV